MIAQENTGMILSGHQPPKVVMKQILVPTDFSGYADFAIASAAKLAYKTGGKITLLHVSDHGQIEMNQQEQIKLMEKSGIMDGVDYELVEVEGNHIQEIVNYPADLIIMGSRVVNGVKGFFNSTNTEQVAKQASCPVLTVKHFVDLTALKTIVYPTDMRSEQEEFVPVLKSLQSMYDAEIHLVKVFEDNVVNEKQVEKRLREFAGFYDLKNYTIHCLPGLNEADEIVHYAESIDADIIAMATHERQGMERLIGGFISGGVMKHSRISIFTKVVGHHF